MIHLVIYSDTSTRTLSTIISTVFTSDVQAHKKVVSAEWSEQAQLRPRSPGYQTRVGDSATQKI